ncbi:MAG TPA: geranylgeranylglyceryl/heptaprenylglyceryl phosphate synthase [Thermoplasmatales archaeon]|nr:geranylgeranylglyceryl/heptaprenylglyceryl phosphate synthase [Thermoplasmatales archaeon]HEX08759.1 geranylgeranylglyceryl/heptaprenylglyceryl phosphate synthase [Thermoplasmatales archaeon]
METMNYITNRLKKGPLHFTLIDPEKQTPEKAGKIAKIAEEAGTDLIMVGGSTITSQQMVDEAVIKIKENTSLPVVLFPTAAKYLSKHADAVFFMSLLNSKNTRHVIREQALGSLIVREYGLEPLPMGYIVIEPGMKVAERGEADVIKRDDIKTAMGYALAAQYLGMKLVYLEAGSGAPYPVSNEMISKIKEIIEIPLIVGGGIRDADTAREKIKAGADIVVTGTVVEEKNMEKKLNEIIKVIKR